MNIFKDLIPEESYKELYKNTRQLNAFSGIELKVLKLEKNEATIRVKQIKKMTDKVYVNKELYDRAFAALSMLKNHGIKVHLRPVVFDLDGLPSISASWVRSQMARLSVRQSQICRDIGVDKSNLSNLLNNKYAFTIWHKAAFYYYFKDIEERNK